MGKPTICIGKNRGVDQLQSNCEADQRLCFHYTDSTIPLLSKSKISSLYPSSVTVQPDLCQIWLEGNCWFSHAQAQLEKKCAKYCSQTPENILRRHDLP